MELIFYCADPDDCSAKLLQRVSALVPTGKLIECRNLKGLRRSLLKRGRDPFVAILLVSNRGDLLDLLAITELLRSIRIILVLRDGEREFISKAHELKPRFLTTEGRSEEVIAVLAKMLRNVKRYHE